MEEGTEGGKDGGTDRGGLQRCEAASKKRISHTPFGLVRKLSKGRFLTLRYKFGQKWYQTDRVDVSNQDVKKFVLRITQGAAGAQKTA